MTTFFEFCHILSSFHGPSFHLPRNIAQKHDYESAEREKQITSSCRWSLVPVSLHPPLRRLENTLKCTTFRIFRHVESEHASLTTKHEAKLNQLVFNLMCLHFIEFQLISSRFNPSNTLYGLWGRFDPITRKIATRKKDSYHLSQVTRLKVSR